MIEFTPFWKNSISYKESLQAQEELKNSCLKNFENFALGFECPATITLGLRGGKEDLLLEEVEYQKKNIPIINIQRGGQATLHSQGQLVIYPIIDIKKNKMRVRDFIQFVELVTKKTLEQLDIQTHKEEDQAGLFTSKGKIAFFGIHVTQGISQHGLSLNVSNDLNLFNYIRSCGMNRRIHDKVSNYHPDISLQEVFNLWLKVAKQTKITVSDLQ